ncbi:hypothetical protein KAU19_03910 [Candidatus Parcubacteria bacterium]|nr:hypothetical protein [Candidatus Parcubacteria bacterium]
MHYKIAQLVLTPKRKADTISEVFVAQPDANKEALAGKLFSLIEIKSKKSDGLKIINFLIDNLNHNYYQNEKIILREKISTLKVEHIFESALAKTNKNFSEFLQNEKIKLDPKLINITVGVIYKNCLHFSNIGKNKALLIYPAPKHCENQFVDESKKRRGVYRDKPANQQSVNKALALPACADRRSRRDKYKIVDVTQQAETNSYRKQFSLTKLFTNVISGTIPRSGYFIFTNETLPEYLSSKQLINIITTLPPASAVEQIKNMLAKINAYVSFLGIIVENTTGFEKIELSQKIPTSSTQASFDSLNTTEETTEKLLTPSGIVKSQKWSAVPGKLFAKINTKFIKSAKSDSQYSGLKDKILFKKATSWLSFKKIVRLTKNIILYFINFIFYFFKIITNKNKLNESFNVCKFKLIKKINNLKYLFANILSQSTKWFKNLSKKNKVLIIIAAICLLFLAQNLFVLNLKNKKITKEQTYANVINLIEQKQNQVEASLLYSNEAAAKKLLDKIKELLVQLPRENAQQIKQFDQFTEKYQQHLEKIRHVIKIQSPAELADFTNLNSNARPISLILINDIIYISDSQQKSIYSLNLADNLITAITDLKLPISQLKYPVVDKNNNIYYFNLDSTIKLDIKTEAMSNLVIKSIEKQQNIVDMASYNNRVYLLDKQNNQIYRYNIGQDSLTGEQLWLKEKADLTDAVSISIDGYIYVLKNNGQLLKYLKGKGQDFELDIVEPALEQPDKLIVSPELKYIYILESINQRLVIFDKTGKFLSQYQGDQFTDLKDFTVNEEEKKIYFLNGTSVYEVEGAHFEE